MSTVELRELLHHLLDQADEDLLVQVYDILKADNAKMSSNNRTSSEKISNKEFKVLAQNVFEKYDNVLKRLAE
jgi:hypothetical protein